MVFFQCIYHCPSSQTNASNLASWCGSWAMLSWRWTRVAQDMQPCCHVNTVLTSASSSNRHRGMKACILFNSICVIKSFCWVFGERWCSSYYQLQYPITGTHYVNFSNWWPHRLRNCHEITTSYSISQKLSFYRMALHEGVTVALFWIFRFQSRC